MEYVKRFAKEIVICMIGLVLMFLTMGLFRRFRRGS